MAWSIRRTFCLVAALTIAAGCSSPRVGAPPSAPSLERPEDAIAADLDVAVRIDLLRMRQALGESATLALKREAGKRMAPDAAQHRLLLDALERADTVWLALRPGLAAESMDNVVVLQGRFEDFDPGSYAGRPRWRAPLDLGGGWRLYERPQPPRRGAPARIYVRGSELVVMVSAAEIDSVERAIELGAGDAHLEPQSKGAISVEARAPGLAAQIRERSPAAARLLLRASRLRAHADLGASGLTAEVEIEFESASSADAAAEATRLLARAVADEGGLASHIATALQTEAVGETLVVRLALDPDRLALLVGCANGRLPCGEQSRVAASEAESSAAAAGASDDVASPPEAEETGAAGQPGSAPP